MQALRSVASVVMSMLLMVALGAAQSPQNRRVSTLGDGPWEFDTADYRIRVVKMVGNLDRPWGMTWLPDGTMLLTERPGRLRIVRSGLLDPQPISGVPTVLFKDFDGLEDVKVHPRYAENHLIYLSSLQAPCGRRRRPVRARARSLRRRARVEGRAGHLHRPRHEPPPPAAES